jgi:RNA polymerase sigma factor (sigma-70 family)
MNDQQLLDAFVRQGSEDALARLVHRHVDLVYSAALRQVRDPHLAEDVTQTTFIALVRHAPRLTGERVLPAWLLLTARNAALDAVKARSRRNRHEREAAQMTPNLRQPPDESEWEQVAPHLDEALASLSADDRRAVTLKYFEGCTAEQVAGRLGVSADAARQRLHRATLRMRGYFARKGLDISAAALGPVIASNAVHAAPPALAAATASALAATVHTAVGASAAKGTVYVIAGTKVKLLAFALAALVVAGGSAIAVRRLAQKPHGTTPVAMVEHAGPAHETPPSQPSTVIGYALTPEGKPVVGAEVVASTQRHYVAISQGSTYSNGTPVPPFLGVGMIKVADYLSFDYLDGQHVMPSRDVKGWQGVTGTDGRFELHLNQPAAGVVVRSKFGVVVAAAADLAQNPRITLQPWGQIEGDVYIGSRVVPKATVTTENLANPQTLNRANIIVQAGALSDGNGHFVIPQAMPGTTIIFRPISMAAENKQLIRHGDAVDFAIFPPWHGSPHQVQIPVGGTVHVSVGGAGRAVIGHVTRDVHSYPFRRVNITPRPASGPNRPIPYTVSVDMTPEGTFRVDDLPAGSYHLHVETGLIAERWSTPPRYRFLDTTAAADKDFEIPPMATARMDEPLDLGATGLSLLPRIDVGKPVPEFTARGKDGATFKLSELKGKFMLLQIGAGAILPAHRDTDRMLAIHDRFLNDPRFTMLSVDSDPPPAKSLEPDVSPWRHATVHDTETDLPRAYLNSGSTLYAIDADGKLVASDIDAFAAYDVLDRTLKPAMGSMRINVDHVRQGLVNPETPYTRVVAPKIDNAARSASVRIMDGQRADNSGPPDRLVDGRMPATDDAPTQNFKFADSTLEGRVGFDLGRTIAISAINSYSWHKDKRAPQVYRVYGSDGASPGFDPAPKNGTDPVVGGWKFIADVDTRPANGPSGGRYAVGISGPSGTLGNYRYLLFVIFPAQADDVSGHTFYSEINVIERK